MTTVHQIFRDAVGIRLRRGERRAERGLPSAFRVRSRALAAGVR